MIATRRNFLIGSLATMFAAPAIVRAGSLMPVKTLKGPFIGDVRFQTMYDEYRYGIYPFVYDGSAWRIHAEFMDDVDRLLKFRTNLLKSDNALRLRSIDGQPSIFRHLESTESRYGSPTVEIRG